jgi:hypothetical protein
MRPRAAPRDGRAHETHADDAVAVERGDRRQVLGRGDVAGVRRGDAEPVGQLPEQSGDVVRVPPAALDPQRHRPPGSGFRPDASG